MSEKAEALRLANDLERAVRQTDADDDVIDVARWFVEDSVAELRRLHAECNRLRVAVLGQSADLATLRAENYETQSLLAGAETECDALRADAERYRWLRAQHWSDSSLCVVAHPKSNLRLGTYCPSAESLDELTDAARAALKEAK